MNDNLRLFDDIERIYLGPPDYSEPKFGYLNRTARNKFAYLRNIIQQWFYEYDAPKEKRTNLHHEFCSSFNSDRTHHSAFFELLVYTLLKKSGFEIQVEPEFKNGTKPDFLAVKNGQEVIVEITGCYSDRNFGAGKIRENKILDVINQRVNLPDFFIDLNIISSPSDNVPEKRLASFIQAQFDELDREQIIDLYKKNGEIPKFEWNEDNWNVQFSPIPKSDKLRGDTSVRNIGIQTYPVTSVDIPNHIKSSLNKKYSHYGEIDKPFLVALNVIDNFSINDDNVSEALFGDYSFPFNDNSARTELTRKPNGAWLGPNGYQKKRMSGLLVFNNLLLWTLHISNPKLWHHPQANYPLNPDLFSISQLIPSESRYKPKEGQQLCDILDVDSEIMYQVER